MRHRLIFGRLSFCWWGRFWSGWWQFGRGFTLVTDKDYTIKAWSFLIGPIEVDWWDRPDWRDFCFTPEEAAAEDARERAEGSEYFPDTPQEEQ